MVKHYSDGSRKFRIISEPSNLLKSIQKRINKLIFEDYKWPKHITGSVKKRSNISNAKLHKGNKFQFTTDIKNCFPYITNKQVYKIFCDLNFSTHTASTLTKLTTINGQLPQGAPTSSYLANLVLIDFVDQKILNRIKQYNITYSRYVDDLSFSSQSDFQYLLPEIIKIIEGNTFNIDYRKTKYKGKQIITGVKVLNNRLSAPDSLKEKALMAETKQSKEGYKRYFDEISKN